MATRSVSKKAPDPARKAGGHGVVEYRWFPATRATGLLGGICARSRNAAEAFNEEEHPLVRVRLEYRLPRRVRPSSAAVVETSSPWQQAADAHDRIEELLTSIPDWDGYEPLEETQVELRQAAGLLHQVVGLLVQASAREAPRCEELTERNGGWSPGIEP